MVMKCQQEAYRETYWFVEILISREDCTELENNGNQKEKN